MKRFEIWAQFDDGITAKVETHKSAEHAQAAIDAMENEDRNDLACSYGFPHGIPAYSIKEVRA